MQQLIAEKIAAKTQQQWLDIIGSEEFCVTPVRSLQEALQSDLTRQQQLLLLQDCDLGRLRYIAPPVKFSEAQYAVKRRAPRLGEHTADILQELGYSEEKIADFKQKDIVR